MTGATQSFDPELLSQRLLAKLSTRNTDNSDDDASMDDSIDTLQFGKGHGDLEKYYDMEAIDEQAKAYPVLEAATYIVPLIWLQVLMDILILLEYKQPLRLLDIALRTLIGIPTISILVLYVHPKRELLRWQAILLASGTAAGCYLVNIVNKRPFSFVITRGPSTAVFLVFSHIEMKLPAMISSGLVILLYSWNGDNGTVKLWGTCTDVAEDT